jgi:nickel transport protein
MRRLAAALALLAAPVAPRAHELVHQVERGRAVAVRVSSPGGGPVADVPWEVYSPARPGTPWQRGRTDRAGWLAFVPDGGGAWRVRVVDPGGHGLVMDVEAAAPPVPEPAAGASAAVAAAPVAPAPAPLAPAPADPGSAAWALRPLLGVAAVGAVFAVLVALRRRREAP